MPDKTVIITRLREVLHSAANAAGDNSRAIAPMEGGLRRLANAFKDARGDIPTKPQRPRRRSPPSPTVPFSDVDSARANAALRRAGYRGPNEDKS
jgi:hypothetical protein